jgi:hypothetical protein
MQTIFPPDPPNFGFSSEARERYQWFLRSVAIISILLAMTILSSETNVMVPKQARTPVALNVDLPRVQQPRVEPVPSIILQPAPQPLASVNPSRSQSRPAGTAAPTSAQPNEPSLPQSTPGLSLMMPDPPTQVAIAPTVQSLKIMPDVAATSTITTSTSFAGIKGPKAAKKVVKAATIGSGMRLGPSVGSPRTVSPASIPGQVGSMKTESHGKVAPVSIPGVAGTGAMGSNGKVATVSIPGTTQITVTPKLPVAPIANKVGILSKVPIQLGSDGPQN